MTDNRKGPRDTCRDDFDSDCFLQYKDLFNLNFLASKTIGNFKPQKFRYLHSKCQRSSGR